MNNANVIKDKFINFLKVNNALENFKNALMILDKKKSKD